MNDVERLLAAREPRLERVFREGLAQFDETGLALDPAISWRDDTAQGEALGRLDALARAYKELER